MTTLSSSRGRLLVARLDVIDEIDDGGAPYRPVRQYFGSRPSA